MCKCSHRDTEHKLVHIQGGYFHTHTQLPKALCSSPEINVYLMSEHPKVTCHYSIYRTDSMFIPDTGEGKNPTPIIFIQ